MSENQEFIPQTEEAAKQLFESQMRTEVPPVVPASTPTSLGKASSLVMEEEPSVVNDLGWVRVKPETLPSQGIFYPEGTEITIRAASAAEIRHWSTIDEEDILSMDDALNRIMERCSKIRMGKMMGTYKDIKEIDRFFIIFAIRELTFKKGENSLNVSFNCNQCGKVDQKTIVKEMLSYYTPVPELDVRFSDELRGFHLKITNGEELKLFLPSLGVMNYIKNYVKDKVQNKQEYDKAFLKWAPFLFADWRTLNDATYNKMLQDSYSWGTDKISVMDWFVTQMQSTVKAEIKNECSVCGEEATAPINFRGGIKSLFLVSDIASKLL
jgi:ribosomal protein L44E